jgi:hypothetical protein
VVVGGKPQDILVRFTLIYIRKNDVWMVEAWHSTSRPSPPG